MKILIVGSLPPPIGGTTVLLKQLVDELSLNANVEVKVINTSGIRNFGLNGVMLFVKAMFLILVEGFRVDIISAHMCDLPFGNVGLYILAVGKLARKPVIFRKFAGTDYMQYLGPIKGRLTHFALCNADIYLAETKHLVTLARERGVSCVEWYSNSRPILGGDAGEVKNRCQRFVFIGHVKEDKGVVELIEAADKLPEHVLVDVYGPFTGAIDETYFYGKRRIRYCGVLEPGNVYTTLRQYDTLVLPTYHPGEGYPGVVLEAYSAGLPVISTYWRAVPEIVDETSGILVQPRNSEELCRAMMRLTEDDDYYQQLCLGARIKAKEFDSLVWTNKFLYFCHHLLTNKD